MITTSQATTWMMIDRCSFGGRRGWLFRMMVRCPLVRRPPPYVHTPRGSCSEHTLFQQRHCPLPEDRLAPEKLEWSPLRKRCPNRIRTTFSPFSSWLPFGYLLSTIYQWYFLRALPLGTAVRCIVVHEQSRRTRRFQLSQQQQHVIRAGKTTGKDSEAGVDRDRA